MISLLYLNKSDEKHIDSSVFSDLKLTSLLDKQVIEILQTPCNEENILARQEFFALLDRADFQTWLDNFYTAIKSFEDYKRLLDDSQTIFEAVIVFSSYLKAYTFALESGYNNFNSQLTAKLSSDFKFLREKSLCIENNIKEYYDLLDNLTVYNASLHHDRIELAAKTENSQSFPEKIYSLSKALGYEKENIRFDKYIRITEDMSNALSALNSAALTRIEELRGIITPYIEEEIITLADDILFYKKIQTLVCRAREKGVDICYPCISKSPEYIAENMYDITLFTDSEQEIIPNDIELTEKNNVFFIRGANGGGKTTYLRGSAINLILFLSGCPVFAKNASIYIFKSIVTHFPKKESNINGSRLEDELARLNDLIDKSGDACFAFLNETFSGTDEEKGSDLALKLAYKLKNNKCFCLFVTHFHRIASKGIPSLTTVMDNNQAEKRTYKIIKDNTLTSSYAEDILKKYRLDRFSLLNRSLCDD